MRHKRKPFIFALSEITAVDYDKFGEPITTLARINAGGVRTVSSIIISKMLFEAYIENGGGSTSNFKYMLNEILQIVKKKLDSFVDIRASFETPLSGYPECIRIHNGPRSIKRAIRNIFSAWSDEKFLAFRIVHDISSPVAFPALLIQNHVRNEMSMVSREPVTGARITSSDIDANVDISIKSYKSIYNSFFMRIERFAGFPVHIIFTETPNLQVCRVEKDEITANGWLHALSSMKSEGILDDIQCLRLIEPDMIMQYSGIRVNTDTGQVIVVSNALSASPGHATGKVHLLTDPLPGDGPPLILVCREVSPEDLDHIDACVGGLSARGGMTSHLAVILRGMGKPGVVGASDLSITKKGVQVQTIDIPRDAYVYVDGNTGRFAFSNEPFQFDPEYQTDTNVVFLSSVLADILKQTSNRKHFSSLSIKDQTHIAELLSALNKIGIELS